MIGKGDVVLVTGATGFTGSVLVRKLCELGADVRAIARQTSRREHLADLPIDWLLADVYDAEVAEPAARSADYIFHVAAAYRSPGIGEEIYRKVHVDSTQLLARAAQDPASRLKRFVHFSTVGVHGHIDHPPADEDAPFKPGDIYQETKAEAELWIREFAQAEDLPLTVIRPAAILGPGDMRLLKLFKMAALPAVPLIGKTRGMYHLIHVDDLVGFSIYVADHPDTLGEVYICGNEEPTSIREIIETVAEWSGKSPSFFRIPAAPVFWIAAACDRLCRSIGVSPPIYPRRVAFFTKDRAFDTTKMHSVDGYQPLFTNATGLRDTYDGYRAQELI
jgi:nucleoside-diphosphate-sugar epimerase